MSILWTSNKEIKKSQNGFLLSGIYSKGSIHSSRVSFSKKIVIAFKFMVNEEYDDNSALVDIDFDNLIDEKVLFISLVLAKQNGKLNFFLRKGEADFHVEYEMDNKLWHDCIIELTHCEDSRIQAVTTVDDKCIAQAFLPKKSDGLWISFGNNHVEPSNNISHSFEIKDISVKVDKENHILTEVILKRLWALSSIQERI
jgi:hypothetical protein